MTVVHELEITRYVEQVRAALADLPAPLRDELTEDLAEHLAEVAAEGEGSLVARLGTPEAYAAELRTAAGAGAPGPRPNLDQRLALARIGLRERLRSADRKLGPLLGHSLASEFLALLRPGWWVLRGYLVALMITSSNGVLPRIGDSVLAGLFVFGAAVLGSVWLGRNAGGFKVWPRRLVHAGTFVLLLIAFVQVVQIDRDARWDYYPEPASYDHTNEIRDIFVYDEQGRLVPNARLFDQNGNLIRLGDEWCWDESRQFTVDVPAGRYPYCPADAPFVFQGEAPDATPAPSGEGSPTPSGEGSPAPSTEGTPAPSAEGAPAPSTGGTPVPPAEPGATPGPADATPAIDPSGGAGN